MTDRGRLAVALLVGWLLAAAVLGPPLAGGRPAGEIPVYRAHAGEALAAPDDPAWGNAPTATTSLSSAPSSVPSADDTTVDRASIQAATRGDRLYLRLSWSDATADRSTDDPRAFADAVAVQLPVDESERPPLAMGSRGSPVNVWYWTPTGSEELLAGGPGTTTRFRNPSVATNATYADGRWAVVFARDLRPAGPNRTAVSGERDVDVAVAVWNGSNMERSGRKAVSSWHYLALGPGPAGPPYEALLWTVAGLAVVVVVAVTGHAVLTQGGDGRG